MCCAREMVDERDTSKRVVDVVDIRREVMMYGWC